MPTVEMEQIQCKIFSRLAGLVQVLGAPARLMLLQILAQGPRSVESSARMAHLTVANASHHLQKMARANLVTVECQGTRRLYRVAVPQILGVWESIQELAHALDPWLDHAESRLAGEGLQGPDSVELIHRQLLGGEAMLIDVRTAAESQATPIPYAEAIPERHLRRRMRQLPKRKVIYVACRGRYCPDATQVVRYLRGQGFHAFRLRQSPFGLARALKSASATRHRRFSGEYLPSGTIS